MKIQRKNTESPTWMSLLRAWIQKKSTYLVILGWIAHAWASELYMTPLPRKLCIRKKWAHRKTSYTRALIFRFCMRKIAFKSENIIHFLPKSPILYEKFSIEHNASHTRWPNLACIVWVGSYMNHRIRRHCMIFSKNMTIFLIHWGQ